jgi:hypothetical protein
MLIQVMALLWFAPIRMMGLHPWDQEKFTTDERKLPFVVQEA